MLGLLIKDFINLKKSAKIFGLVTILYAFFAIASEELSFFTSISIMLFAILTMNVFSHDEVAKWDSYALTMPVSRDNIVQSKYIMTLFLSLAGLVYSISFTLIINVYLKSEMVRDHIVSSLIGTAIVLLFFSIIIPVITKIGMEKARLILVLVYMIPFAISYFYKTALDKGNVAVPESILRIVTICVDNAYIILPVFLLLAIAISYYISLRIYRKKEF